MRLRWKEFQSEKPREIVQFRGFECDSMIAVGGRDNASLILARIDGAWIRFFIDESVLFLSNLTSSPEEELEGEEYTELISSPSIVESFVYLVSPARLVIRIDSDIPLMISIIPNEQDGHRIEVTVVAQ